VGIRPHVVLAVMRRNFAAYFGSPTGYVFITIFIVTSAFCAFSEAFFGNNLADLASLNAVFLWLLVFFTPAIAMGAWAEERRMGADELLFTLPVRDIEVVLGKYLAILGVYTVSLVFSLSNAVALSCLGRPDWGLLTANYLGYWLAGAALIPVALAASALTANMTVAFILGALFCSCAVFAGGVLAALPGMEARFAAGVALPAHFEPFTLGVAPLADVLYFVIVAAVMLYINMILIGRRHWSGGADGETMGRHYLLRGAAVIVAGVSLSVLAGRFLGSSRLDLTVERLNSVSPQTAQLLKNLPGDRPVYVRAYVSPEAPESYAKTRQDLIRLLNEAQALSGGRVVATVINTEPNSDEARDAEERFTIKPRPITEFEEGRIRSRELFLGLAFTCGPEETVIDFLDRGLSIEYELIRSISAVAGAKRRKVGILSTDAQLYGGFDFQSMSPRQSWAIVDELKKQYDVVQAEASAPIAEDIDVLIAALPSSLGQAQMDNLAAYIKSGRPALLLEDPLPLRFPQLSPSQPKPPQQRNPMYGRQPPEEKGDIDGLLEQIGLSWNKEVVVWDAYNPLPKLTEMPAEVVFVCKEAGGARPFNKEEGVVKDLERVVMMFAGALRPSPGSKLAVTPLLTTGETSGQLQWKNIISAHPFGMGMTFNPSRRYVPTKTQYMLAARVSGEFPEDKAVEKKDGKDDKEAKTAAAKRANVIVVADLDIISEDFFQLRKQGIKDLNFDNVTFVLNCVDFLAGDSSLIAVRNRRPQYRTLAAIEKQRKDFRDKKLKEDEAAEKLAEDEIAQAQKRVDEKLEDLRKNKDYDSRTKEIMLDNLEKVENSRLKAAKAGVEAKKRDRIKSAEQEMLRNVRRIENNARLWAIVLPPLPALVIGLFVFMAQRMREARSARSK